MAKAIRLSKRDAPKQIGLRARRKKIIRTLVGAVDEPTNLAEPLTEEDPRWLEDIVTLRKAAEELVKTRQHGLTNLSKQSSFRTTAALLNDPSPDTRKFAVRTLYELDPDQAATFVNRALRDGSQQERRNIGAALADSGLLFEAIDDLMAENHERCYGAFSLLFLVAKAGVVEPLSTVIEKNPSLDLSLAIIRLLATSGEPEVAATLERLAANESLPPELRSAAAESIDRKL